MASLRLLSVLALLVTVAAAADYSADVKKVETEGSGLAAKLQEQWTAQQAQQAKSLSAAESKLSSGQAAAVATAFKTLAADVEPKIVANLTAFIAQQQKETKEIVKKYETLLNERLSSASTEEAPIHEIRQSSQAVVNAWVPLLSQIHDYAHQAFEAAVRKLADANPHTQAGDADRVAVTNAGIQVLETLVSSQNEDTFLLTSTQFGLFNDYLQHAETTLINLLVAAKQNGGGSAAAPAAAASDEDADESEDSDDSDDSEDADDE